MISLKNKLDNYTSDDFGHNTTPELDEVINKINKDVKKTVLEDINTFKIFEELIIKELKQKDNILTIKRLLSNYKHNKKEIFGDYKK